MSANAPSRKAKAPRTPMPEQPPRERACNFQEVALGYTPEMARAEAARCLQCKKPACRKGCPVEVDFEERVDRLRGAWPKFYPSRPFRARDSLLVTLLARKGFHALCPDDFAESRLILLSKRSVQRNCF